MKKLIFILIFSINMSLADKVLTEDNIKSCIQYYNYKDIDAFSIMCIDNTAYLSKNGLLKMKNEIVSNEETTSRQLCWD